MLFAYLYIHVFPVFVLFYLFLSFISPFFYYSPYFLKCSYSIFDVSTSLFLPTSLIPLYCSSFYLFNPHIFILLPSLSASSSSYLHNYRSASFYSLSSSFFFLSLEIAPSTLEIPFSFFLFAFGVFFFIKVSSFRLPLFISETVLFI